MHGGGTSLVIITKDGVMVELTSKAEIERSLLEENESKHHQAEGCSQLLAGALLADISLLGDGPHVRNILNGTYIIPDKANPGSHMYLSCSLLILQGVARSHKPYSVEDFKLGWKKMKE